MYKVIVLKKFNSSYDLLRKLLKWENIYNDKSYIDDLLRV